MLLRSSHGEGVWKSLDAGKTWQFLGLGDSRHVPRIRVHPRDPRTVYVATLGHLFGSNDERGVYRSIDGGLNWRRVLFVNRDAGAIDLVLDPSNPRIVYASTWRVRRTPWSLESGGAGSALWKSTDGGDTWKELTQNVGMPGITKEERKPAAERLLGIIGITVSFILGIVIGGIAGFFGGMVDNVIRTWVLQSDAQLHPLLAFVSVLKKSSPGFAPARSNCACR